MPDESRYKILSKNTFWVYINKILTQGLGFIVSILIIRKLPVEVFGTFNFLLSTFVVFEIFSLSPLGTVINRYVPELQSKKDFRKIRKLILFGVVIVIPVITLLLLLISVFEIQFGTFFKINDFHLYFGVFIVYSICAFSKQLLINIFAALLLHKLSSILNIITSFIKPLIYLYFLSVLDIQLLLKIESFTAAFFTVPAFVLLIVYYRKMAGTERENLPDRSITKKRILRFGFFSSINELGSAVVGKTSDYFIISAIGNQYAVGLYAFAYKLYQVFFGLFPLKDFQSVLRPLFFQKFTEKYNREEFITVFNFIIKMLLPIYLFPFLYFAVFGKAIISYVYDPKYLDAYLVTCIILFSHIVSAFFYPQGLTIILKEKMEIAFYSKSIFILSLFLGIYSMKYFGIIGVALATFFGDFTRNVFMHILMRKHADMVYRFKQYINYLFASLLILTAFFSTSLIVTNLFTLIIMTLCFGIASLLLFINLHPFSDDDLRILQKVVDNSRYLGKFKPVVRKLYITEKWRLLRS